MKCPNCKNELADKDVGGVTVDICNGGCGGLWFDNFEFKKFDEPHESAGEELLNIDIKERLKTDFDKKRGCPKCSDVVMRRHFFSTKKSVEIDECPSCNGIWLDPTELGMIRSLFNSEEEKNKATDEYFSKGFDSALSDLRKERESASTKLHRFANMFKYICPSNYI
jgi:Zn-finger nucleic acid-binding protein